MLHVREILLDSLVDTDMHAKVVTAEAGDTISLLMAVDALDRGQRMLLDSYKQSVEGYENLCWWQSNLRRVQGGSGIGALLWALYARFKEGGLPEHS